MFILCAALNTAEVEQSQHAIIKEENINEFWGTRENSFMAGFFRWALASYEGLGNRRMLDFPEWTEKAEDIFQSSVLWLSNMKKRRINSKCQHLSVGTELNSFSDFTWMTFALFQLPCVEVYSLGVVLLRAMLNVISAMGTTEGQYGHLWTMLDMEKVIWYFCEIENGLHSIILFFSLAS